MDDTNPKVLRRLETRLLVCDTNGGVYGASYKWRADNSDADIVTAGVTEPITINTADGTRTQNWFYPGRQDCLTCHTPASGGVLGVKTRQLNGNYTYPNGVTDNQLRTWNHLELFDRKVTDAAIYRFPRLVNITNNAAPLQLRVRSYLDANCAQCHRPGGAGAFFDARFETPLSKQNLVNGPVANQLGIVGAKVIVPGDTNKSILYRRDTIVGQGQMPPLGKNVVDTAAVVVIGKWISSLPLIPVTLPRNWVTTDIGNVGSTGDASFLNGVFNVVASGEDFWESADSGHFAGKPLTGDGQIVAHVVSMAYTDPWAKAGVMFRENFEAGSRYAFMATTAQGGAAFQRRTTANAITGNTDGPPLDAPHWVKLVRNGDLFTGYVSMDGQNWKRVDSISIPLGKTVYAGLAVSAHNNAALNSTVFDKVTVDKVSVSQ